MRALLALALIAGSARAESSEMLLVALGRSMDRQETTCTGHLAELQRRGVAITRTVRTKYGSRYLRAGVHPLTVVRTACDAMQTAAIERAIRDARDPAKRAACVRVWTEAKAAGFFDHRLAATVKAVCE